LPEAEAAGQPVKAPQPTLLLRWLSLPPAAAAALLRWFSLPPAAAAVASAAAEPAEQASAADDASVENKAASTKCPRLGPHLSSPDIWEDASMEPLSGPPAPPAPQVSLEVSLPSPAPQSPAQAAPPSPALPPPQFARKTPSFWNPRRPSSSRAVTGTSNSLFALAARRVRSVFACLLSVSSPAWCL